MATTGAKPARLCIDRCLSVTMTMFESVIGQGLPGRRPMTSLPLKSRVIITDSECPGRHKDGRRQSPCCHRQTEAVPARLHHRWPHQPTPRTDNVALLALSLSTWIIIENGGVCGNELSDRVGHKVQLVAATVRNAGLKNKGLLWCGGDAQGH